MSHPILSKNICGILRKKSISLRLVRFTEIHLRTRFNWYTSHKDLPLSFFIFYICTNLSTLELVRKNKHCRFSIFNIISTALQSIQDDSFHLIQAFTQLISHSVCFSFSFYFWYVMHALSKIGCLKCISL